MTAVYDPKAFILHAASLRQGCPHCGRSSTAASRRSLGSVPVPVRPTNLSVRLPVFALVSRYLTNKLIGHRLLPGRQALRSPPFTISGPSGISTRFQVLFRALGQMIDVLLALSPLNQTLRPDPVRLACLIHAASVRSEPGSNSSKISLFEFNSGT